MPKKKLEVAEDVLTLARERVSTIFDRYDHVSVSFSGGKDSTVVLHLVHEEAQRRKRDIGVVFFDEEAIHPETIDYVARVTQLPGVRFRWLCWPVLHRNACSKREPWWWPWAPEAREKWCRPLPAVAELGPAEWQTDPKARKTITEIQSMVYPPELGTVGVVLGIRAQESLRRYRSVAQRTLDNWIAVDSYSNRGIYLCKPIYDWRTEDVWTAPARFGWDYNRAYDVMHAAGIAPHDQRVCPPYGEEPLRGLWQYAVCWPDLWERMTGRVAGARTAGRYSRSPLYGHGERVDAPPDGVTWQEFISWELDRWGPKERSAIAARIRDEIATHNRATKNAPIPDMSDPKAGGLSWQFIHMIAKRGDLKKRRTINRVDTMIKKETGDAE